MVSESAYQVEVTVPAQLRYEAEVLLYLYKHFSIERAIKIDSAIADAIESLYTNPQ